MDPLYVCMACACPGDGSYPLGYPIWCRPHPAPLPDRTLDGFYFLFGPMLPGRILDGFFFDPSVEFLEGGRY